ncbi:MAG: M48 family metalloprotease, partial [Pseudomonadales bacterium]|nr:M48 family metalloprotease [Pseudomonadales bacterium]
KAQQDSLPTLAALLASLILIATTEGDAGIAALSATQAGSLQNRLRYSRQYEAEADSLGIETMMNAGYDPKAVPVMFERMLRTTRFMTNRMPEFLLTHPITERRIADTRNRVDKLPAKAYPESLAFHLVRSRIRFHHEESPYTALKFFSSEIAGESLNPVASRYGYALALIKTSQFEAAEKEIRALLDLDSDNLFFQILNVEYLNASGQHQKALDYLKPLTADTHKASYPLLYQMSRTLTYTGDFKATEKLLENMVYERPEDTLLWYDLAEVRGLAGNIAGVHLARTEYFILNGIYNEARKQLDYAKKLLKDDTLQNARIKQRLRDIENMEKAAEKL